MSMVERVAEAISLSFREEGYIEGVSQPEEWNEFLKAARAAIEAYEKALKEGLPRGY